MKIRYRQGFEGRIARQPVLILQVYKHFPEEVTDSYGGSRPGFDAWVDATAEDLTEVENARPMAIVARGEQK